MLELADRFRCSTDEVLAWTVQEYNARLAYMHNVGGE